MRVLYKGLSGDDVLAWEHFLLGINPFSNLVADGKFDDPTKQETESFQRIVGFSGHDVDGVVGPMTMGKAMGLGFDPLHDDRVDEFSPNWPPPPNHGSLSLIDREKLFGKFAFKSAGTPANPEAIIMTDKWSLKNIVSVNIPQLKKVQGAPKSCNVQCHKLIGPQLSKLFLDWENAGLSDRVLTWAGCWAPRFIRGSRTILSNHAWGNAFDINVQWNMLGTSGALKGEKGSVRELIQIAYDNGFYSGLWFKTRKDPMHMEVYKIL